MCICRGHEDPRWPWPERRTDHVAGCSPSPLAARPLAPSLVLADGVEQGAALLGIVQVAHADHRVLDARLALPLLHPGADHEGEPLEDRLGEDRVVRVLVRVLELGELVGGPPAEDLWGAIVERVEPHGPVLVRGGEARHVAPHALVPLPAARLASPALCVVSDHLLLALRARRVEGLAAARKVEHRGHELGDHGGVLVGEVARLDLRGGAPPAGHRAAAAARAARGEVDDARRATVVGPHLELRRAGLVGVQRHAAAVELGGEGPAVPLGEPRALHGHHVPRLPREVGRRVVPEGELDAIARVVGNVGHALDHLPPGLGGEVHHVAHAGEHGDHVRLGVRLPAGEVADGHKVVAHLGHL
mmetsp:Transcript_450/g.1383  ORF Transcript_450/g.1383 Transcript_450/m.1383 type:complete len:360 (+) Transcript_450:251-1330(+)